MAHLLITFPGSYPKLVRLPDVLESRTPGSGSPSYLLTRQQASQVIAGWFKSFDENERSFVQLSGIDQTSLSPSQDLLSPEWRAARGGTDAEEYWDLGEFPHALHLSDLSRRRRPLADQEALDRIANYLNEPGPWNGGDVCDAVASIIRATGRPLVEE